MKLQPFRARFKKIQQDVKDDDLSTRPPQEPVAPLSEGSLSLANQFEKEAIELGVKIQRLPEKELSVSLENWLHEQGIDRVCVDDCGQKYVTQTPFVRTPDPTVRVGITGTLLGIAESGSLVIVGGTGQPLTASLLPDIHVAILRESDLVPTLAEAMKRPEIQTAPASVIITGPSRTADIEMTLTIGVHGPVEVHVFLIS